MEEDPGLSCNVGMSSIWVSEIILGLVIEIVEICWNLAAGFVLKYEYKGKKL